MIHRVIWFCALTACGGAAASKNADVPMPTGPGTRRSLELSDSTDDVADAGARPADGLSTPAIVQKVMRDAHQE